MPSPGAGTDAAGHPVLTPQSVAWRHGSDSRALLMAGRALLLQIAHPTVAAGVREHSSYRSDPWGRLERTLDSLYTVLYSRDAAAEAARLRALHRRIRGVAPDGQRYHALEPEAYAWVHATIVETIVTAQAWCGRPLRGERLDRYYAEMRAIGGLLGIREHDLPERWPQFREYVDAMVQTRLEDSDVVRDFLDTLAHPTRPPGVPLPAGVWSLVRRPAVHLVRLGTVGLLPPVLRARFGLSWGTVDDVEMRALGAALRAADPLLPERLRIVGPQYLAAQRRRGRIPPAAAPLAS